jgi:hypothetical protein
VVCHVDGKVTDPWTTSLDLITFTIEFVPEQEVLLYVNSYKFGRNIESVFLEAIKNYDAEGELLMLLAANEHTEANLLQNLAIKPAECYRQVCQRWEEFQT